MKAGLPSASTTINNTSKALDASVPEALARRDGLARSKSNAEITESSVVKPQQPKPFPNTRDDVSSPPPDKTTAEFQKPTVASTKVGGNFNASLAGILSRGFPAPKSASGIGTTDIPSPRTEGTPSTTMASESSSTPQLSHMTKGRARGPKRRLPTVVDQSATTSPPSPTSRPGPAADVFIDKTLNRNGPDGQNQR